METYYFILFFTLSITVVGSIGALLWQWLLSRDKQINQQAQFRALEKEIEALEHLRQQQNNQPYFQAHYAVLGENSEAIKQIDTKISELFNKKIQLIESYGKIIQNQSEEITKKIFSISPIKMQLAFHHDYCQAMEAYDRELTSLQVQRAGLWTVQNDLQKHLLHEEKIKNEKLDSLYHHHTMLLEKIYLSHMKNLEEIDKASIEAGKESIRYNMFYPFQFLASFFTGKSKLDVHKNSMSELAARKAVLETQNQINQNLAPNMATASY